MLRQRFKLGKQVRAPQITLRQWTVTRKTVTHCVSKHVPDDDRAEPKSKRPTKPLAHTEAAPSIWGYGVFF